MHNIEHTKKNFIHQRLKSFKFAAQGIVAFIRQTPNAWIQLVAAIMVVMAGFMFHISINEWIAVIFAISMVITAEAFNTTVEEWVDTVHPEYNEKAGNVKDISAGAVLITAISATVIGLLIFIPKLFPLLLQ